MAETGIKLNYECGATFSPCRKYRYSLWRNWERGAMVAFIGLNPSTADETVDDPTIRRCIGFAKAWGFGGLYMLNAYAFRATDPKVMQRELDPVGVDNNGVISCLGRSVELVIACWGAHCTESRERKVCEVIGKSIYCLGKTKSGRPKHPLYLAACSERELFWMPKAEATHG